MTGRMKMLAAAGGFAVLLPAIGYATGAAGTVRRFAGLPDREEIAQWWIHQGTQTVLPRSKSALVFLITGQSNAGNYGRGVRRTADSRVYNAWHGHLYLARDPLLGSDGLGISPWIDFAQQLLERGVTQNVVLALAVRGGMGVNQWAENASMRSEVFLRLRDLREVGLTPDYVLWQQGENDAPPYRTSPQSYANSLRGLIGALRHAGVSAPVFVAQVSRNRANVPSQPLRAAQRELVDPAGRIARGPDLDSLDQEFRYDGIHFSERGIAKVSQMWVDAVTRAMPDSGGVSLVRPFDASK